MGVAAVIYVIWKHKKASMHQRSEYHELDHMSYEDDEMDSPMDGVEVAHWHPDESMGGDVENKGPVDLPSTLSDPDEFKAIEDMASVHGLTSHLNLHQVLEALKRQTDPEKLATEVQSIMSCYLE